MGRCDISEIRLVSEGGTVSKGFLPSFEGGRDDGRNVPSGLRGLG